MKSQIGKILVGLVCCGATWASAADYIGVWNYSHFNTPLRVLLQRSRDSVSLRGMSPATVRINGELKPARLSAGSEWLSIQNRKVQMVRCPYRPLVGDSFEFGWPLEGAGFEWKGKKYRGRVKVEFREGDLFVVNLLPLETYLAGTVGGEMSSAWSLEALKAQAVAARSYALHRRERPRHALFDLDSTTEDQVYLGMAGESPRAWAAVKQTAGVYLASGSAPAAIHYHSRCGGETETASTVWGGGNRAPQRVPCPYCMRFPFRWSASWNPAEFLAKLGLPFTNRLGFFPTRQAPRGRIYEVEVVSGSERRRLSSETLRRLLGYTTLKSTQFVLSHTGTQIQADGVGAGHGVGMCQWGAKYLAEKGATYSEILSHYYPRHALARWSSEKEVDRQRVADVGYTHDRPARVRFSASRDAHRAFPRNTP